MAMVATTTTTMMMNGVDDDDDDEDDDDFLQASVSCVGNLILQCMKTIVRAKLQWLLHVACCNCAVCVSA